MKPVAWIREDGVVAFHEKKEVDSQGFKWFALYTHPVKEEYEFFDRTASHMAGEYVSHPVKELTDEEIKEVWMNRPANTAEGVIEFARAILRKAQEK